MPPHARTMRALVATVLLLLLLPVSTATAAEPKAASAVVEAVLADDGTLTVTETVTFDTAPEQLQQRLARTVTREDDDLVFTIDEVSASVDGKKVDATVDNDGDHTVVTVTTSGAKKATVSYRVNGTVHPQTSERVEWRWPLWQGVNVAVAEFAATVSIPGDAFRDIACESGPASGPGVCSEFNGGIPPNVVPKVSDGPLAADDVVNVRIGLDAATMPVTEMTRNRWSPARAFSLGPIPLAAALAALLLGLAALWWLHRRSGRDASHVTPTTVAGFETVDNGHSRFVVPSDVRPGHIGTLVDERVDPVDLVAALLDLAVRGHLRIAEIAPASGAVLPDWALERRESDEPLDGHEALLLDAVAPEGGGTVSDLSDHVSARVGEIQAALYDEMVQRGWYHHRPDHVRGRWMRWAFIAAAFSALAAAALIVFTSFGWLALVLLLLPVGLWWVAQEMPARTAAGSAVLAGLQGLHGELSVHPTDAAPAGEEFVELSRVLPYAVVLGGQDRWLHAVVAADDDADSDETDLHWYHGPTGWHLQQFPASIEAFVTTVTGILYRR